MTPRREALWTNAIPGEYQDRRHLTKIDCTKTIWILATNAHDPIIQQFCSANHRVLFIDDDEPEKIRLIKQLSKEIKEDFLSKFNVSVGRFLVLEQASALQPKEDIAANEERETYSPQ